MLDKPITEKGLVGWMALSIAFMLLVFSEQFGLVYITLTVVWFIFLMLDKYGRRYPIERSTKNRLESIIIAIIFYAAFLIITSLIMVTFIPGAMPSSGAFNTDNFKQIIQYMGSWMLQATKPALQESKILLFLGFTLIIGTVETVVICGRVMESIHDSLMKKGFSFNKINPTLLITFGISGAVAVGLHLSAKLTSPELIATFVFFALSAALVWWKREMLAAILVHAINNGIAISDRLGLINLQEQSIVVPFWNTNLGGLLIGGAAVVGALLLLPRMVNYIRANQFRIKWVI